MTDVQRDLGRHDAEIEALQNDVGDLRDYVQSWREDSDKKLEEILTKLNRAEGGLRTLLGVGSIAGAVGAAVTAAIAKMKGL